MPALTQQERATLSRFEPLMNRMIAFMERASQSPAERPGPVATKKDLEVRTVARAHMFARFEKSLTPAEKTEHGGQAGIESAMCDPEGRDTLRLLAAPLKDKYFCAAFHVARNKTVLAARRFAQGLPQRARH
jgi:hypothetical protein